MSSKSNDIDEIGNLISVGDFASLADLHLIPCAIYLKDTLMVAQSRHHLGTYLARVYAAVGLIDGDPVDIELVAEPSNGSSGQIVTAKWSGNAIRFYCVADRGGIRIAMMEAMPESLDASPKRLARLN